MIINADKFQVIVFDRNMEVLKRKRNNSEKQPCFGNYFLQLESRKKQECRVSFQTLYLDDLFKQIF